MNQKQKAVLWVAIAMFVLMGLVPPWIVSFRADRYAASRYAPIFAAPHSGRIDVGRLFIQWITLGGASAAVIFALKKP